MARIERIAADARQIFRGGIVFPNTSSGGNTVEGETRGSVNCSKEEGVGSRPHPAHILNTEFVVASIEPDGRGLEAEIKESNAALAIGSGEMKVRGGGLCREEFMAEGERGPPHRGDKRGKRISSGRRRRHGNDGDELHRTRINDGDGTAGGESKETGGADVGGSEVVTAWRARKHAVPRVMVL